jgi:hypothetical protein
VCSSFGDQASNLTAAASELLNDPNRLVRTRAAEFLGLLGAIDPSPTLMQCLADCESGVEANLILNSVVLLRDGPHGHAFEIDADDLPESAANYSDVKRRLSYLQSTDRIPVDPQGKGR